MAHLDENTPWTRPSPQSVQSAFHTIFQSSTTLEKLKDSAVQGQLLAHAGSVESGQSEGLVGRSVAWKLFLLPSPPLISTLPSPVQPPLEPLRKLRAEYVRQLKDKMRAPDGSYAEDLIIPGETSPPKEEKKSSGNWSRNNPLSLEEDSGWHDWFAAIDLRKTIRQDVERTFPDIPYFRNTSAQSLLVRILFLFATSRPEIGYRQGMHELLAPIFYAVDFDSLDTSPSSTSNLELAELCDRQWIAADAWALFIAVMANASEWYEWREPAVSAPANGQVEIKAYIAPIVGVCNRIHGDFLRVVDPLLYSKLQESDIEPQIYGIRWLRLLFTREFNMADSLALWDALFAADNTLDLAQWVCVAMLLRIRNQLISADSGQIFTSLLRYPASTPSPILNTPHTALLVRQALALRSLPTSYTGASISMENQSLLGVPIEIPEPPPPERGKGRPRGERRRSIGSAQAPGHKRDQSGLADMIARGLLDINGAVLNTVSEIRRNLPDLQNPNHMTRTISSDSTSAFPYQAIQRASEQKHHWEPHNRFTLEKEVADLRGLQKKLGAAVGRAVDILSQGDVTDARRKEALDSLGYVRDVLGHGGAVNVDERRLLLGEEEITRQEPVVETSTTHTLLNPPQSPTEAPRPSSQPRETPRPPLPPSSPPTRPASSPLAPSDPLGRPQTYLSSRDSKPISTLTRTPYRSPPRTSSPQSQLSRRATMQTYPAPHSSVKPPSPPPIPGAWRSSATPIEYTSKPQPHTPAVYPPPGRQVPSSEASTTITAAPQRRNITKPTIPQADPLGALK